MSTRPMGTAGVGGATWTRKFRLLTSASLALSMVLTGAAASAAQMPGSATTFQRPTPTAPTYVSESRQPTSAALSHITPGLPTAVSTPQTQLRLRGRSGVVTAGSPLAGEGVSASVQPSTTNSAAPSSDTSGIDNPAMSASLPAASYHVAWKSTQVANSLGVVGLVAQISPVATAPTTDQRTGNATGTTPSAKAQKIGGPSIDTVAVTFDYSGIVTAFTPDGLTRLEATQLVGCPALQETDSDAATAASWARVKSSCERRAKLVSHNDLKAKRLTVQVPVGASRVTSTTGKSTSATPTTIAIAAGASGSTGDFTASPLSRSASWAAGDPSGAFSWTYPFSMPPTQGGPAPQLTLSYSSQAVDGHTASTNNQASWVGEGFALTSNFVERRYQSCSDNDTTNKTGDLCWAGDNLTLSLNGKASELLWDAAASRWRMKDDDGTKIEKLNYGNSTTNGDAGVAGNDGIGEYWRVTDLEGTQFYFGVNRLPGWTSSAQDTNSVNLVPVFGNNAGEPCYVGTDFDKNYCTQAWRWNLDRVVDVDGNSASYYYAKQSGYYGRNMTASKMSQYDFGSNLTRIDYGMRAGSELTSPATQRVVMDLRNRCRSEASGCVSPAADTDSGEWPDVPWSQWCQLNVRTSCPHYSPTFWSTKRLGGITTQVLTSSSGSGTYKNVDIWQLKHTLPNPNAGTTAAANEVLWLDRLKHTSYNGQSTGVTSPDVIFGGVSLQNRVNRVNDGLPPMNSFRIETIRGDSGDLLQVKYSRDTIDIDPGAAQNCTETDPDTLNPTTNTKRCFPAWYGPYSTTKADWFHRYLALQVTESVEDAAQAKVSTYEYRGNPAWAKDDDDLTPASKRLYNQWRGYGTVRTISGSLAIDPDDDRGVTDTTYYRGQGSTVTDSLGTAHADGVEKNGRLLETVTYGGLTPTGTLRHALTSTVTDYWRSGINATRGPYDSRMVRPSTVTARTWLPDTSTWRTARTTTSYNGYGLSTQVDDDGDVAVTTDDQCTTTTYAGANTSAWLVGQPSRVQVVAAGCGTTPTMPRDAISDTRYYYDNATSLTAAPSKGHATKTETLSKYVSGAPTYQADAVTVFDTHGRVTKVTDVLGRQVQTVYTPATGGPVTATASIDAMGFTTTTTQDTSTGKPLTTTDPNGKVTTMTYDAAGRVTQSWTPNWSQSAHPTMPVAKYTYSIGVLQADPTQATGRNYTSVSTLRAYGETYRTTYNLLDGLLRPIQTQSSSASVNSGTERVIDTTFYNTRGLVDKTYDGFVAAGAASGAFFGTEDQLVDAQTWTTYDGASRPTLVRHMPQAKEKTRTTTVYHGDHTDLLPSGDASARSTFTNARGQSIEVRLYSGPTVGSVFDATKYTYTRPGQLETVKDAGGAVWTYTYDERGRVTQVDDPDKGLITSTYYDNDAVKTTTDARAQTIYTAYDDNDRITATRVDSGTGRKLQTFTYDTLPGSSTPTVKGQLTSSSSWAQVGGATYEYVTRVDMFNNAYQPTSQTTIIPAVEGPLQGSYTTTSVYDSASGATLYDTLPAVGGWGSEQVVRDYNSEGLPRSVRSDDKGYFVSDSTYTPYGDVESLIGNAGNQNQIDQVRNYTPDTRRLTRSWTQQHFTGASITDLRYTYSDDGDLTRISEAVTGDTQCFGFDGQRRLTQAWTPAAQGTSACTAAPTKATLGGPAPYWQEWDYNPDGTRKKQVSRGAGTAPNYTDTYSYPAAGAPQEHAPTGVASSKAAPTITGTYNWDAAGFLKTRPGHSYEWDEFGRLGSDTTKRIATGATIGVSSYVYDGAGQRLLRHDKDGVTLYLGNTEVRYEASQYGVTRYYQFAGETVAVRSTAVGATGSKVAWCLNDHHGTTVATFDTKNNTTINRRYETPFGDERTATGLGGTGATDLQGPIAGQRSFVGGTEDEEGTIHLGAREYLPQLGAFLSVDPVIDVIDVAQLNPYTYAHNDPINGSDPSGLAMKDDSHGGGGSTTSDDDTGSGARDTQGQSIPKSNHARTPRGTTSQYSRTTVTVSGHTATVTRTVITRSYRKPPVVQTFVATYDLPPEPPQEEEKSGWSRVWDVVADVTGINDVISCVTNPSVGSCVMAAIDVATTFVPVAKGAVLAVKGVRAGAKALKATEELTAVDRTLNAAGEACRVGNSFAAGTRVLLADGTSKSIDTVQVGDLVLASDPATGVTAAEPVTATILGIGNKNMVDLGIRDAYGQTSVVATTDNHPFWDATTHTWVKARELTIGHALSSSSRTALNESTSSGQSDRPTVVAMRAYVHFTPVYNLTVRSLHTYFVRTESTEVLVHNCAAARRLTWDENAVGPHSTFFTNAEGKVTKYATWAENTNPNYPHRFVLEKRFDPAGSKPHFDKATGQDIPAPHVKTESGTRPAEKWEIPR